ncbi:hypothetical protein DJ84_23590 [Halorubrum ezzemoulense]|nr:hypothetical protein DJ84_23590 [Halorubrum ezzemoulense]
MALLYESFPDHNFWTSDTFKRILSYVENPKYMDGLENNKFGFPYNPPGFEAAFALETFRGKETRDLQRNWVGRQLKHTYDPDTERLSRNTPDAETLTARIYEATRLPDLALSQDFD